MNLAGFASYDRGQDKCKESAGVDKPQEGCQEILVRILSCPDNRAS